VDQVRMSVYVCACASYFVSSFNFILSYFYFFIFYIDLILKKRKFRVAGVANPLAFFSK